MKKIICITTALILVLSSFALAFADSAYEVNFGSDGNTFEYYYGTVSPGVAFDITFLEPESLDSFEEYGWSDRLWLRIYALGAPGSIITATLDSEVMDYYYDDDEFNEERFEEDFTSGNDFFLYADADYDPETNVLSIEYNEFNEDFWDYITDYKLISTTLENTFYDGKIALELDYTIVPSEETEGFETDPEDMVARNLNVDTYLPQILPYARDAIKLLETAEYLEDDGHISFTFDRPSNLEKPAVFNDFLESLGYDPQPGTDPVSPGLTGILSSIGSVFTAGITWVSTVVSTITETPLLLIFAIVPLIGLGVGLTKRLLNLN